METTILFVNLSPLVPEVGSHPRKQVYPFLAS